MAGVSLVPSLLQIVPAVLVDPSRLGRADLVKLLVRR